MMAATASLQYAAAAWNNSLPPAFDFNIFDCVNDDACMMTSPVTDISLRTELETDFDRYIQLDLLDDLTSSSPLLWQPVSSCCSSSNDSFVTDLDTSNNSNWSSTGGSDVTMDDVTSSSPWQHDDDNDMMLLTTLRPVSAVIPTVVESERLTEEDCDWHAQPLLPSPALSSSSSSSSLSSSSAAAAAASTYVTEYHARPVTVVQQECMEYRPISAKGHVKPDVFDDIVGYDVSSDVTVTRPRGISSSSSSSSSSSCVVPPSPTKKRSRRRPAKQQVLWEFLLETLSNPDYNPVYIEWVDRALGIFRFVQSQQVAKLWGQRRKRRNMCYEYFSRAMRYYYARGIMTRVCGRRLVYQFGPNAAGWQLDCCNALQS